VWVSESVWATACAWASGSESVWVTAWGWELGSVWELDLASEYASALGSVWVSGSA
jgi:hypothetical protein